MSSAALKGLVLAAFLVVFGLIVHGHSSQASTFVTPVTPRVLSGNDLGFRVTGMKGDTPVGTLVVRIGNEWVPVEFPAGVFKAGTAD